MFYRKYLGRLSNRRSFPLKGLNILLVLLFVVATHSQPAFSQIYKYEMASSGKATLSIRNRNGRVSVIAAAENQSVTLEASSPGSPVDGSEVQTTSRRGAVVIDIRDRGEKDRIDLVVHVPLRSKVKVESEAGAVDIVGNLEVADVSTNTGTIHADVPLDAVKFDFLWTASRPRYLSDVELPDVKEKRGGVFAISGKLGEEKPEREERIQLAFQTRRGVMLLNVDPSMAPSDLREKPLTEAARAIVRGGESELVEAIRKVSPKMFGDYAKTLPPPEREPSLVRQQPPGQIVSAVAPQVMRFNASVTDTNGRAIGGMRETDFTVYENGVERKVINVAPANEPFNLVLLLDVSGSVEERIDFIRKAARDFLNTASPQDRIAIISFRDDIQVISDFSTDRQMLSQKLHSIKAGGGTALYDSLGYVLSGPLRELRGERTAIVILSDGDDNKSFVPFPALLDAVSESGALIYPLYVPSGLIPEGSVPKPEVTIDPLRTRYLTLTTRADEEGAKLASVSGGVYYSVRRIEDLQRAYDDVVLQLRTSYTISYASNSDPSGSRRVRVRTNRDGSSVRLSPAVNSAAP